MYFKIYNLFFNCSLSNLGSADAASELRKELGSLRARVEQMDIELKTRDDEIKRLQAANKQPQSQLEAHSRSQDERLKVNE